MSYNHVVRNSILLLLLVACGRSSDRIDPPAAPGAMAPQLHVHGDTLLATWIEPSDSARRVRFARWHHDAWSQPVTIVDDAKLLANWADTPTIASAPDGALVVSWAERSGGAPHAYDAVVARSTDGGRTWKRLGKLHRDATQTEHGFVSFAPDAGGVRAIWLDGRASAEQSGGATALRTAVVGESIGAEAVIDDRVCDCCGTALATAPTGAIAVYRDRSADEVRDISIAVHRAAWSAPRTLHDDRWQIAGCPVNGPAIATRGNVVAIAWYTGAGSTPRVRAALSRDGGATFTTPIEIDAPRGDRQPIGRVGITFAGDAAAVTWMASRGEAADILARRVSMAGIAGDELVVARTSASRDAGFPRVASIGAKLFVAWTEPTKPSKLRLVAR